MASCLNSISRSPYRSNSGIPNCVLLATTLLSWPSMLEESRAQTKWNVAIGSWFEPNNWTSGVPRSSSDTIIDINGTSQVFDPNAVAGFIRIGNVSFGTVEIADGGTLTNLNAHLGEFTGGQGSVVVSGSDSLWISNNLLVGNYGTGLVSVEEGGTATSSTAWIGYQSESAGTLNLNGVGTSWTTGQFTIGRDGAGVFAVATGASAFSSTTRLGWKIGSEGTVLVTGIGSSWENNSYLFVGDDGIGELTISDGASVSNTFGSIAEGTGSIGSVTVRDAGSNWANSGNLEIGKEGTANLTIVNGGHVDVTQDTFIGQAGGVGSIDFANGTITTRSLFAGSNQLEGLGTVNARGLVSDVDLVFDQTHGMQQQIILSNQPSQNITINIELDGTGSLGAGYTGQGSLLVTDGLTVTSSAGYLGFRDGSKGMATVTGTGSQWNITNDLEIGRRGMGEMRISDGAGVSNSRATIGTEDIGSQGVITVTGNGSTWTLSSYLYVGEYGSGNLTITDAASVSNTIGAIAFEAGSTGEVFVTGAHSSWFNSLAVFVGRSGTGKLTIDDGGQVNSASGLIGWDTGARGVAIVTGESSAWITEGVIYVGRSGIGSLEISDGGTLSSYHGFIGDNPSATGTATVSGPTSTWNASGNVIAGFEGLGELTVSNGGFVSSGPGALGLGASAKGAVLITGENSRWIIGGSFRIGGSGLAELKIMDGGRIESTTAEIGQNANALGSVVVSGSGSEWNNSFDLFIAGKSDSAGGDGSILVTEAGKVTVGTKIKVWGRGIITQETSSQIVVSSGDTTSVSASEGLFLGTGIGTGIIEIVGGGDVICTTAVLGIDAGSTGTATLANSGTSWTSQGLLEIGKAGSGNLTINSGSRVTNAESIIALMPGSSGSVTVTGTNSIWENNGSLQIGSQGTATLAITSRGRVTSADSYIAKALGSSGTVTVSGTNSTWSVSGDLSMGGETNQSGGVGLLTISSNATVSVSKDITLYPQATINFQGGTLSADSIDFQGTGGQFNWTSGTLHVGTYNGNLSNTGGRLAPGQSAGSTTVNGNYTQGSSATLEIEIGGITPGTQHDSVSITGTTTLGGSLQLSLLDDYIPAAIDTFTVLDSTGTLTGAFTNVANAGRLATTNGIGSFLVHYGTESAFNPNHVVLTDFILTGDYNHDGVINAADFVLWRDTDGAPAGYTTWQSHFGLAAGTGMSDSLQSTVPEPSTWVLILAAAVASMRYLRRPLCHFRA